MTKDKIKKKEEANDLLSQTLTVGRSMFRLN